MYSIAPLQMAVIINIRLPLELAAPVDMEPNMVHSFFCQQDSVPDSSRTQR